MTTVQLQSQDGETFTIDIEVAKKSEVIKNMIEGRIYKKDCGIEDEIPLTNVSSKCLKKVLEYCEHHRKDEPEEIPKPLKTCNLAELVSEYDAKFIDIDDLEGIFDIIMAANYLDIKSLLDLSCAKIATLIKGKTPEEIRKTFNIVNDFTPEEEAQIREENKWAEDDI